MSQKIYKDNLFFNVSVSYMTTPRHHEERVKQTVFTLDRSNLAGKSLLKFSFVHQRSAVYAPLRRSPFERQRALQEWPIALGTESAAWVDPPLFPSEPIISESGRGRASRTCALRGRRRGVDEVFRDEGAGGGGRRPAAAVAAAAASRAPGGPVGAQHSAARRGSAPLHPGLAESGLPAAAGLVRRGQVRGVPALGRVLGAGLGQRVVLVALEGRGAAAVPALHERQLPARLQLRRLRAAVHDALLPPRQLGGPLPGRRGQVSVAAGRAERPFPGPGCPEQREGAGQVGPERGEVRRLARVAQLSIWRDTSGVVFASCRMQN